MYSQNNEEEIVLEYFKGQKGVLLDIGANDGRTLSNSLALIERGWTGTLVEASPKAFERLQSEYKNKSKLVQLIHSAIGSYDGEIDLNESGSLLGTGDTSLVSSTRQDEVDRWASLNLPFEKVRVPVMTFASLMCESDYPYFGFISIDIEGMEPEVVPQINFRELGVKMAIIEWNGKNADLYDTHLANHGMGLHHVNAENRIYTLHHGK